MWDPYWLTATISSIILYHIYAIHLLQLHPQALPSEETYNVAGKAEGLQKSHTSPCITTWPESLQSFSLQHFALLSLSVTMIKAEWPTFPSSPFSPFSFLGCCQYYCPGCPAWGPSSLLLQAAMCFPSCIILKSLHLSLTFTLWSYDTDRLLLISTVAPLLLFDLLSPLKKPATNHLPYLLLCWCHMGSASAPSHRDHSTIFCFSHPHMFKISNIFLQSSA